VRGALAGPLRAAPPGADERRRVLRVAIAVAVGVAALVAALDAVGRVGAWTQRPGERPWATGR
jgi:multisubunit Na+/H+ antiporter MnhB subunit